MVTMRQNSKKKYPVCSTRSSGLLLTKSVKQRPVPAVASATSATKKKMKLATLNKKRPSPSSKNRQELQAFSKTIQKQKGRKYLDDNTRQRQRLHTATKAQPSGPMFRSVRYARLIERLDELYASDRFRGRDAMQQYVSKFVRLHLTVKDALIQKMKGKPPSTSLSSEPSNKNKNNNNNKLSLDGRLMVNIGKQHFEVAIHHHMTNLFKIKRSSLQNASLGLFAARKYKNGSCLGYYCGKIVTCLAYCHTKYAIMTNTNPPICVQARPQDVWMGFHFANDTNYGKYGQEEVDKDDPTYNIRIDRKLRVTALKDIEPDEELFLHYNL